MTVLRVLVVDDDRRFLEEVQRVLRERKYSVVASENYDEALSCVARVRGQMAVVSALAAGGRSGLTFLKETLKKYPCVPFTFVAEAPPLEEVIEALKQGAYDFLRKPVAPDILCHSVARSVEKLNLALEAQRQESENKRLLGQSRKRLEAAEKASRFKGFLISMAAHDFRSIVTVLDSYHERLMETGLTCGRPDCANLVEQARRNIARLRRMAGTLLDYEAAERGELRVECRPFDLDALIEECAAFYGPFAEQKKVSLAIESPLPPIVGKGDPDRVMEVLDNIVYNAVKFTPPEGKIRIGARPDGGRAVVWVRDTGSGIPRQYLDDLALGDHKATLQNAGMRAGIGLQICRRLLELQQGTLSIASEPGSGTTIFFSLPL